jgi:tetratricopeptide (TPR) repeat protein
MPRCLSCGRRVRDVHAPCGTAPDAPAPAAIGELPVVRGFGSTELLGGGGFGVVLAATRASDGARVALKLARGGVAAAAEQLRREAEALRAIGPPAVPALLEEGALEGGAPWLAMELLSGPSLAMRLEAGFEARGGALPPGELAPAALALVDAVAAVHRAGWAHGDVKPENVVLEGAAARARLLDLGLAERLEGRAATAATAGTAEYMAPELCAGAARSAAGDLYALGVLLFELATGHVPFHGPPGEVRHAHLAQRPPRPGALDAVSGAFADAVLRCLAKRPEDRFPSAGALRAALDAAFSAASRAAPSRPAPAAAGAARLARRRLGIAFLEADPVAVQAASLGGAVAHAEPGRCALAFDAAAGENPVRLALRAARAALARGLARRVRVDLVLATVQPRAGGGERHLCAAFSDPASWPAAGDPAAVLVTARAAEVLPEEPLQPVDGRPGLFLREDVQDLADDGTVVAARGPALVGRDGVLEELLALARSARGGAPAVASVVAEGGIGKTHLAAALARLAAVDAPGFDAVVLRAGPAEGAGEGGVLADVVRFALGISARRLAPPADGGRALIGLALPQDAPDDLWAGAALALGWLDPGDPALRARAAAPGALTALAVQAAAALLRCRAARRPVAILVDDAHLADAAALDALELAALEESRAPIFACALARPSFAQTRPAWGGRAARCVALRLGPLEPDAAAELCRRLLLPADPVPAAAVAWLVARSHGVPLLLSELVRGLKRSGLVRRRARGGSHYVATDELERVPDLPVVEWLAARELGALPPDLAAHAQLAALVGEAVAREELAALVLALDGAGHGERFPLDAGVATQRLVANGLLVARRDGRVAFRLPVVREALARAVPDALRRAIHAAAVERYRRPGVAPEPLRLRRLAEHAAAAGHAGEAAACHLALAAAAARRHDYLEADARYARALEHLPAGASPERFAALRGRGLVRVWVGRHADAVADLAAARELARALGDGLGEVECLLDEATVLDHTSDFAASAARAAEAEALAGAHRGRLGAALALARGRALFRAARWADAAEALEAAARLAEADEDGGYPTLVAALLLLGTSLPALGRPAAGEAALARAQDLAVGRGDLAHVAFLHINRRNLLVARGDAAGAVRDQLESVRIGREMGVVSTEYMGVYNVAELHYQCGDPAAGAPQLRRARELEERYPHEVPLPLSSLLAARALLFEGDLAGARRTHDEFVARLAEAAPHGARLGPADAVLVDMVEHGSRLAGDAEWERLAARSARDSVEQEPIEVLEAWGLAALRAGRPERARAALDAALALGERIPNLLAPRVRRALAAARSR